MKIAVLTSGGDSAGMNAVVRAVVKAGILKYVLLLCVIFPKIGEGEGLAF
jgi:6-phosphofructokinase